ncbi:4a-hydroxytetrahydrobiopterin dehydratase [Kitasatospora sp. NBC_00240]|uniref:VOC family protein n=1 Tax=Kitasatospora sp. NBC_00240 TaxID=2903567 RepID=UPI00225395F6|nr:VOC family protein [Kitasatospora sp. NBC_00240]MCX5208722.1 4a-hydroxytetrahydrobiopterin dehydratase [Kitasatospora sp. NBC_00240]
MKRTLSGPEASDALNDTGWCYLLESLRTSVPAGSLAEGIELATRAVAACGEHADGHLQADVRRGLVLLTLRSPDRAAVTTRDVDLAHRISAAVRAAGSRTEPGGGPEAPRTVQLLELAIDALDPAALRPFWKAVLGYADEAGASGPAAPLVDPLGQGPAIWFQQMDRARPQRNRLHLDICVPHDEAPRRIEAALAAGGRLLSATRAPAFWVLADAEGNEACVTTWQGRD